LAQAPIALAEVQSYAYAAWRGAAGLAAFLGDGERARALEDRADMLRQHFEARFWCDEMGTYALALDGHKQACRVRSSNAGHSLLSGIAAPKRALRVAETLFSPESFSHWGIRTIAEGEARYNPMSYHNGSVWPHDNALIAMGLARYNLRAPLLQLMTGMFGASQFLDLRRLPELFCGFTRRQGEGPTIYPVACLPQAWSSATVFALLGAMLGISFNPENCQIRFTRPIMPPWLDAITLQGLALCDASVDLEFHRHHGNDVSVNVLRKEGDVEVLVVN
jgi:glycogen debranching enzyme